MKPKIITQLVIYVFLMSNTFAQQLAITSQKVIGGTAYDEARCLLQTKDGGMILAGRSYSNKSAQKKRKTQEAILITGSSKQPRQEK